MYINCPHSHARFCLPWNVSRYIRTCIYVYVQCFIQKFLQEGGFARGGFARGGFARGGCHIVWACDVKIPRGAHRIQEGANAPPAPPLNETLMYVYVIVYTRFHTGFHSGGRGISGGKHVCLEI